MGGLGGGLMNAVLDQDGDGDVDLSDLLRMGGCMPDQVNTVFFTGGTSVVPLVRAEICAVVPNARVMDGDPMGAVGHGLALDAARRA